MEEEIDIYADLPNFNLGDNENLAEINKKISEKCSKLEKQVDELTQSLESVRKINKNLQVNISSLLQTAKAEIARKDRMIASMRSELDNIQFRRGSHSHSAKSTRRSSPKKSTKIVVKEERQPQTPEISEPIEIIVHKETPSFEKSIDDADRGQHRLNGVVNTVFGERLRRRILESQEEERRQRERSKTEDEQGLKIIGENCAPGEKRNSELHRSEDIDSDRKVNCKKDARRDRKRCSEHRMDTIHPKKLKYNETKGGRRVDEKPRDTADNSPNIEPGEERCGETAIENEGKNVAVAEENETEERHNRVAMRLMLLSEGIDPDIGTNGCVKNEGNKVVEEKRQEQNKGEKTRRRSRSKSRGDDLKIKRQNERTKSVTSDEYYKSTRGGKQRDNRHRGGRDRDRFDRRRDSKNKDGDNMSEFSRDIFDLKERFESRIGQDRSNDRTGRSGSYNRQKRSDDKTHRNGRSRTPDSGESGSKERTANKFRNGRRYGRSSRSRERRKSRNSKERRCSVDASGGNLKSAVPARAERNEGALQVLHTRETNPETKSLVSLEDGEIVDSAGSSPRKFPESVRSLTAKGMPPETKSNSSDPAKLERKETDARDIGNNSSRDDGRSPIGEKSALNMPEPTRTVMTNDCLNSSKDERIENIAEFIANFATADQTLESFDDEKHIYARINDSDKTTEKEVGGKIDFQPDDVAVAKEIISEEKLKNILSSTEFQDSMKYSDVVTNDEPINHANNVNDKEGREDWRLIAIDSPVKNFEENRQNRIMAINAQVMENAEPLNIPSVTSSAVESCVNKACEEAKVALDEALKPPLPVLSSDNNAPKTRPPVVLRALRSIYRRGKKKMVLSDTNSEQFAKISLTNSTKKHSQTEQLNRVKNVAESRTNIVEERREETSESSRFANVDNNCEISVDDCKERRSDDVRCDNDATKNVANRQRSAGNPEPNSSVKKNVESRTVHIINENNESFETNEVKTCDETSEKLGVSPKSEVYSDTGGEAKNPKIEAYNMAEGIGSNSETESRIKKSNEGREKSFDVTVDSRDERAKDSPRKEVESNDKKVGEELKKLVVLVGRRRPIHLEDSLTSFGATANSKSSNIESINDYERTTDENVEALVSPNIDDELSIGNRNRESQKPTSPANGALPNEH